MNLRRIMPVGLIAILASCTFENVPAGAPDADDTNVRVAAAESSRVKDRVLDILCDTGPPNVQEELVVVAAYVRKRDGHSDRLWEVADQADCREFSGNSVT